MNPQDPKVQNVWVSQMSFIVHIGCPYDLDMYTGSQEGTQMEELKSLQSFDIRVTLFRTG